MDIINETAQEATQEQKLKSLNITAVTTMQLMELDAALVELALVKAELESRIVQAIEKNESIKTRLEALEAEAVLKIDREQSAHFEQSIKTYLSLLYNITLELKSEIEYYAQFLVNPRPETVMVHESTADDARVAVQKSIDWIRRHSKAVRKGMAVSYSRYGFSLDSQMKQLDHIERNKR